MADADYKRLCSFGTCGGKHKAQGYCLRHYRQWQRGEVKPDATNCGHCGKALEGKQNNAMYCGKRCKQEAWKAANPEHWIALNARKVSAVYAGYCVTCGGAYCGKRERMYCTPACEPRYSDTVYVLGVYYTPPVRTCQHCGLQWSAIRRLGPSSYCQSPECQEAWRIAVRRAAAHKSHVERAKKHGRRYGYFNVMRVFTRDKWRCQLCGAKTPKSLRGTTNPRAPEVGHIVAIANGGDHLIENIQCECRACNAAKGTAARGQTWLEGFADTK